METDVRPARKYEKVVGAIKDAISRGELAYGDALPPERAMIDQFGVSRGSLREAFSVLELLGLIESKPGSGRFVRSPHAFPEGSSAGAVPLESSAVLELMEARRILDPAIASEAARRSSPSDMTRIRRILTSTRENLDDLTHRARSDFDFHMALASATQNFLFVNIVRMEFNLIMATHESIYGLLEDKCAFADEHEALYEAITVHDANRASAAASLHIDRIYRTLLGAFAMFQP
ncbi:MAG: FadR family transcriptional regulator [Synergistaceae bacterium]|jgi:GntR family transcriptional repressor for pyruvate dehydrogenase complex|nr:FadR family transcriptional regulator [Synergistaceae bacterium]